MPCQETAPHEEATFCAMLAPVSPALPHAGAPLRANGAATDRRRRLQPLWNGLSAHCRPHLRQGLLLAVSGGPDSRALLEAVARWPARHEGEIAVACVDHGVRPEATEEAARVVARAAVLGFSARALTVTSTSAGEGALREARYGALCHEAARQQLAAIVTAHHAGDVAEGVLLSWLGQGGGPLGAAMESGKPVMDRVVLRPFLSMPRESVRDALAALGIQDAFVDQLDLRGVSARARVRLDLLVPLARVRRDVEARLAAAAHRVREDDDALAGLVPPGRVFDAQLPPAVLRRALKRAVSEIAAAGTVRTAATAATEKTDVRSSGRAVDDVIRLVRARKTGPVDLRAARALIRKTPAGGLEVAVEPAQTHNARSMAKNSAGNSVGR